jgi:hypothetical protein
MKPLPMNGTTVSGVVYVVVEANRKIEEVTFYLDDPDLQGPPHTTVTEDPFIMILDTTELSDGQHILSAATTVGKSNKKKSLLQVTFTVQNTLPEPNAAPTADAGNDMIVPISSSAALSGSVDDDGRPDGQLVAQWSASNGPGAVIFSNSAAPVTSAAFERAGIYTLQLSASDGVFTSFDEVDITVEDDGSSPPPSPDNDPPTVDAGSDQSVTLPDSATLSGSAIDDGRPSSSLTVQWSKIAGPGSVAFANAGQAQTTATFSTAGTYTLQLSASDGELTTTDQLDIAVEAAPTGPPPPGDDDVVLPARAAFYYPWYPQTWSVNGSQVFFQPTLGYYSSDDTAVVDQHIDDLDHAKIEVAIASWWGPGAQNEQSRIPLLLDRTEALGSPLRWSFYYEDEGFGNPSIATIQSDLDYLLASYGDHPSLARIDGRPVIFVYNADDSSCEVADRWNAAVNGWHVVLKVFSGYRSCANQPDGWHQYSPVIPADHQSGYAYSISPGFWRADEGTPRLARDLARFEQNVRDMVASGDPWQLITTYNEWGEGTAIESEAGWGSGYLDALARDGVAGPPPPAPVSVSLAPGNVTLAPDESTTVTATVTGDSGEGVTWSTSGGSITGSGLSVTYTAPSSTGSYTVTATSVADSSRFDRANVTVATSPPPPSGSATLGIVGDFGGKDDRAGTLMTDFATRNLDAFFILGDLSYSEITPEQAWCDWVHGYLGPSYPMQVLVGNHEEEGGPDGYILDFTPCMPDRLGSELGPGGYGVNYASDLGPITVIALATDVTVGGVKYDFDPGSAERTWLASVVQSAQAEGDWVIVGMHKVCITIGNKSCEIGDSFAQALIDLGVDVVFHGHDHDYQRSHSLALITENDVPANAIADSGNDDLYTAGAGTVFVVVGTGGRSLTTCSHSDSEFGYFATHHCGEEGASDKGYVLIEASPSELQMSFVATIGSFSDTFTIH